jgi:NADP-dependent 3-hydroxy acid dehydrogenase YdfG
MNDFTGQTAVITGATGGVGGAIAARLIASGARAVLVGRTPAALERLTTDSKWTATTVRCCAVDLAIEAEVRAFAEDICDAYPEVHILVHAAGVIVPALFEKSQLAELDGQYLINARAPYQLTQALLPRMLTCGGQVVFVNSSAGVNARGGVSQYAASKHALRAIADSIRDEVNQRGVRVMSIFLGRTASRMQAHIHQHEGRSYHPERLLQPDDVASMVVAALCLPRTAEVTDLHIRPMLKS